MRVHSTGVAYQARQCDVKCVHDVTTARIFEERYRLRTGLRIGPPGPETTLLRGIVQCRVKEGFLAPEDRF
jgi:hypothetical protein